MNNAGIVQMLPAVDYSPESWSREFSVNVQGMMNGAQAACRAFGGKGGAIVNIASNAGKVGFPNMAADNATEDAVINLSRSLAPRTGRKADQRQCGMPNLGSVATPMVRDVAETLAAGTGRSSDSLFAGMVPAQLGRHVQPIEVGRVVVLRLSDAAEIIRGQSIVVSFFEHRAPCAVDRGRPYAGEISSGGTLWPAGSKTRAGGCPPARSSTTPASFVGLRGLRCQGTWAFLTATMHWCFPEACAYFRGSRWRLARPHRLIF